MRNSIKLVKLRPDAVVPERATYGSFGYDLTLVESVSIEPNKTELGSTGLRLGDNLPVSEELTLVQQADGHSSAVLTGGVAMFILPRSSLSRSWNCIVPNSPGLVDADYTGEIKVMLRNIGTEPVTIPAGTRIAQIVFSYLEIFPIEVIETPLQKTERGGFGSTGV